MYKIKERELYLFFIQKFFQYATKWLKNIFVSKLLELNNHIQYTLLVSGIKIIIQPFFNVLIKIKNNMEDTMKYIQKIYNNRYYKIPFEIFFTRYLLQDNALFEIFDRYQLFASFRWIWSPNLIWSPNPPPLINIKFFLLPTTATSSQL